MSDEKKDTRSSSLITHHSLLLSHHSSLMNPQRWQQIDSILDIILDTVPQDRQTVLNSLCADDISLERHVLTLLAATENNSRFISKPLANVVQAFKNNADATSPDQNLGAYKIVREIGRGGMGVVYLAERDDGAYQQQVAIKIVGSQLLHPLGEELIQRFRLERQILASLNHPNIARLFDGGTTAAGLPYVVMEYVEGVPLKEYCEQNQLSLQARLRLFQNVCGAVQFAHQKLIVHRDLKPGNILVNQEGVVKLLDFGIAKLLQPELSSSLTEAPPTLQIMTPEYASPEQIRGEPISTSTDVYALGLILYEVLTSQRAYTTKNLPLTEMIRVVCEEVPAKPSVIVKNRKPDSTSSNSDKLTANLAGDLDTILLTALEKAPEKRYASVAQFSEDIERYLTGLPIQARPATISYRTKKFFRRNKKAVFAAVLLFLTILAGIFSTLRQTNIAQNLAQTRRRELYTTQMSLAAQAWETNNLTRLRELLAGHFPTSGEDDLRGFEWYYFWRLLHRNGQILSLSHPSGVTSAAYSPDDTLLATACEDQIVRLWSAGNGGLLAELTGHTNFVNHIAFNSNGKKIISSSSDLTAIIWDVSSRQKLLTLRGHTSKVNQAVFSPEGLRIATCADDGTWKLWDSSTGTEIFSVKGPGELMRTISFSPDGKIVATGGNQSSVKLWNAHNGKDIPFVGNLEKWQCWSLDFSPDGTKLAAAGLSSIIKIWELKANREIASFSTYAIQVHEIAFAPDGKTLATTSDKSIITLWDSEKQKPVAQLKGHTNYIFSASFSPDGQRLITSALDNSARLWDVWELISNFDHEKLPGAFSVISYSPDYRHFVRGNEQNSIALVDLSNGQIQQSFRGHQSYITKIIFSPDGQRVASGSTDHTVKVWDQKTGSELYTCIGHTDEITALHYSNDGNVLFSAGREQTLRGWSAKTGESIFTSAQLTGFINKIATSADGKLLATASYDSQVRLWETKNWQVIKSFKGHARPVSMLAFSPDGKLLATGGEDDIVKLWETSSGKEVSSINGLLGHISALTFSPDGKRLAIATNDGFVSLWDPYSHLEILNSKRHQSPIFLLTFTPDGRTMISGDRSGVVRYWRTASSEEVKNEN